MRAESSWSFSQDELHKPNDAVAAIADALEGQSFGFVFGKPPRFWHAFCKVAPCMVQGLEALQVVASCACQHHAARRWLSSDVGFMSLVLESITDLLPVKLPWVTP